jgi:hypothetical protein
VKKLLSFFYGIACAITIPAAAQSTLQFTATLSGANEAVTNASPVAVGEILRSLAIS